jgi:hypothetical protein
MKIGLPSLAVVIICAVLIAAVPAAADVLFENGPINGQTDAWTINFGFVVSDSFTLSTGNSTLGGVSFGAWLSPGDVLESAEVTLTSEPFGGTTYFDQVVDFAQSDCFINNYSFQVCTETGTFNGPLLGNGTYWLNLWNAVSADGDPVYWDENSGIGCHSPGCPSQAGPLTGSIPSEAFSILGTPGNGTVPEPPALLLFSSGVLAVAGVLRRRFL